MMSTKFQISDTQPRLWKNMLSLVILLSYFTGSCMKLIIYKHFVNQKRILERPINVLIIIDQVYVDG